FPGKVLGAFSLYIPPLLLLLLALLFLKHKKNRSKRRSREQEKGFCRAEASLTRWRWGLGILLAAGIGLPLAMPFVDLLGHPGGWKTWKELDRLLALAVNTLGLMAGTLVLALPTGAALAVLLYRTDLPGRRFFRYLTVLALFVPLPLLVTAWQS